MDVAWDKGKSLRLDSGEFYLRSLTEDDITPQYIAWMNDPDILAFINSRNRKNNYDTIHAYVKRHDNCSNFHLGIFVKETDEHIGNYSIHCDENNKTAITHVLIGDKNWWGKAVVLKTREMVLSFLFDERNFFKVCGTPLSKNIPAVFNYKKQGFVVEGILKNQVLLKDGSRCDVVQFALFRDDFKPVYVQR